MPSRTCCRMSWIVAFRGSDFLEELLEGGQGEKSLLDLGLMLLVLLLWLLLWWLLQLMLLRRMLLLWLWLLMLLPTPPGATDEAGTTRPNAAVRLSQTARSLTRTSAIVGRDSRHVETGKRLSWGLVRAKRCSTRRSSRRGSFTASPRACADKRASNQTEASSRLPFRSATISQNWSRSRWDLRSGGPLEVAGSSIGKSSKAS
mmetsp:Transcript_19004/g.40939  ORF Transcript_19004/g.40939 Transcript_19004/m.40939 type:complete len:203 (-) Transcript_19004:269-877(-)